DKLRPVSEALEPLDDELAQPQAWTAGRLLVLRVRQPSRLLRGVDAGGNAVGGLQVAHKVLPDREGNTRQADEIASPWLYAKPPPPPRHRPPASSYSRVVETRPDPAPAFAPGSGAAP